MALSKLKRSAVLVGVVAVLAAGYVIAQQKPDAKKPGQQQNEERAALTVTATTLRSESVARTVTATGGIHAWQEVIIGPEVGGYRVAAVLVDVGDKVKKGQELVRLSADLLEAEVSSRRAALRSAQADSINAEASWKRGQQVSQSGALSTADLDTLRAQQVAAQARVQTAEADVRTSELRLKYTHVTAPDDGVITSRDVTVGQIAQQGNELMRLLRQNRVEWRAEVPETQLRNIKAGQNVRVTTVDGGTLKGKVRTVAPTIQLSNRTGLVYADIIEGEARPGMFARGEIETNNAEANFMPLAGVVMQDGYAYVFVLNASNKVERRRVVTGSVRGSQIEIASGVSAGERIVVQGAGFLKDGDLVRVAPAQTQTSPAQTQTPASRTPA